MAVKCRIFPSLYEVKKEKDPHSIVNTNIYSTAGYVWRRIHFDLFGSQNHNIQIEYLLIQQSPGQFVLAEEQGGALSCSRMVYMVASHTTSSSDVLCSMLVYMVASHTTSSSDVVLGWYIWWPLTQLVALMLF